MPTVTSFRIINAPLERVFDVSAHVENFPKAVPEITKIEILNDAQNGIGTRFRETRDIQGRIVSNEVEVTDYALNKLSRTVFESSDIFWDSIFEVTPHAEGTLLTLKMEATAQTETAKAALAPVMEVIGAHVESDMDAIKTYCESLNEG